MWVRRSQRPSPHLCCCLCSAQRFGHAQRVLPGPLLPVHGHSSLPVLGLAEVALRLAPRTLRLQRLQRWPLRVACDAQENRLHARRKDVHALHTPLRAPDTRAPAPPPGEPAAAARGAAAAQGSAAAPTCGWPCTWPWPRPPGLRPRRPFLHPQTGGRPRRRPRAWCRTAAAPAAAGGRAPRGVRPPSCLAVGAGGGVGGGGPGHARQRPGRTARAASVRAGSRTCAHPHVHGIHGCPCGQVVPLRLLPVCA
jgi:hypothetical protein